MAKGTAICKCKTCGKEFKREKYCYSRKEANEYEAWAVDYYEECPDCYKVRRGKENAEKYAAENAKAANYAAANNLPELKGTVKQVAWANSIRAKMIAEMESRVSENSKTASQAELVWTDKILNYVKTKLVSASYWIDNQDDYYAIVRYANLQLPEADRAPGLK